VIDGNVCSGKTTQCNILRAIGYSVLSERIQDWPLKLFYSNKQRWALLLQFSILKSFQKVSKIYERSPESSKCVFWKMLFDDDIINDDENDIYSYYWGHLGWSPDVHIYIDTPPEICYSRLKFRFQEGDVDISLDYLKQIDKYYKEYIATKKNVFVIDGTQDTDTIHEKIKNIILDDMSWYNQVRRWLQNT